MKKWIIISCLVMAASWGNAQIHALTDTGDQVVLYQNGTWRYVNDSVQAQPAITTNTTPLLRDKKSTFLVKSKVMNVGVWINPMNWTFFKGFTDKNAEFQFQKKHTDLFAFMITESIQVPLETIGEIAFQNAQNSSPDAKIIKEEYRTVNGNRVLMMEMTATLKGVHFMYEGYYYSNSHGSMQLVVFSSKNLIQQYTADIDSFLNGLVTL